MFPFFKKVLFLVFLMYYNISFCVCSPSLVILFSYFNILLIYFFLKWILDFPFSHIHTCPLDPMVYIFLSMVLFGMIWQLFVISFIFHGQIHNHHIYWARNMNVICYSHLIENGIPHLKYSFLLFSSKVSVCIVYSILFFSTVFPFVEQLWTSLSPSKHHTDPSAFQLF